MPIILTPEAILLLTLLVNNAIREAMDKIGSMTPEEVDAALLSEEHRKMDLMAKLNQH